MKVIGNRSMNMFNVLPDQIEDEHLNYIPHKYLIESDGYTLNCITGEAVKDISFETDRSELIRRWFLVPEEFDINGLMYLMRQIRLSKIQNTPVTDYTIFTTMQCNGNCPYCFQNGKHEDLFMNETLALDIANYIKKHSDLSKRLTLRWFGGEPLLNMNAINTICQSLRDSNINYSSYLTTNGELFPLVTDKDIYFWNLKIVQFSIDYPGEDYDKAKGLPKGAYERLKDTVKRLEDLKISKRIRIHYHTDTGIEPVYKIIEDFKDVKYGSMYISVLYGDNAGKEDFDKILEAEKLLVSYGKLGYSLPNTGKPSNCMADNLFSKTITAEGGLTPCEHYSYEENYGTIYSDTFNEDVIKKWHSKRKYDLKCIDCPLYPTCELLAACPAIAKCENGFKDYMIERAKRALRNLGGSNEQRKVN